MTLSYILQLLLAFPGDSVVMNSFARQDTQRWQFNSLGWEDPRDEEMAIHSSDLAWKVSWAEEPGRLQSMRSQKTWIWVSETVYVFCTFFFNHFFRSHWGKNKIVFGTLKDSTPVLSLASSNISNNSCVLIGVVMNSFSSKVWILLTNTTKNKNRNHISHIIISLGNAFLMNVSF